MNLENIYVIRGNDDPIDLQPLFWNNTDGYCDLTQADTFLEQDIKADTFLEQDIKAGKYNLPMEGRWQNLKSALTELIEWQEDKEQQALDQAGMI